MNAELMALKSKYIDSMTEKIPDDLEYLKKEITKFCRYEDVNAWGVNWSRDNIDFLEDVGLPISAPTMIEFQSPADIRPEYVHIGSNNYGDKIVIVKRTGTVAYINHDQHNKVQYINYDAITLFKSICAFAATIAGHTGFPERVSAVDHDAYKEGNWWHQEYLAWRKNKK